MRQGTDPQRSIDDRGNLALDASLLKLSAVLAGLAGALYLCYRISVPFFPALTWAMVLAVILAPAHRRVERWIPRPNLSASASVAATAIAVALPLFFLGQQLAHEMADGMAYLDRTYQTFDLSELVGRHAWLSQVMAWLEGRFDVTSLLAGLARSVAQLSTSLFRGSLSQTLGVIMTFYMLFYFLRDRRSIFATLIAFSPLSTTETKRITRRLTETIYVSVLGTVVIGFVQGTLGGLMFWWLNLPTPVFWGSLMGLLAVIPILGAFVVWIPAAVFLALEGRWEAAITLAVWGSAVIATVDNLLYPVLAGNQLKLHTLTAFIGIVGGIALFGASGLLLGPAVITVTLELLDILRQRSLKHIRCDKLHTKLLGRGRN